MPSSAIGMQTVFGTAVETAYGTPVTPNRWYEIVSETLERQQNVLQSSGLRAGAANSRNLRLGTRRALTHRWAQGDVVMEVATRGMGRWFAQMLGGTPTVVQQAATDAWLHTYSMGSLAGKSLTVQKGVRDQAGTTVEKFTYHGCKVTSWDLAIAVGEILRLTVSLDAEDEDTTTALASHSYTEAGLLYFAQGTLKVDGATVAKVTDANVSGDNALRTDAFFLGTGGLKGEPEPNDFPSVTGGLTAEFDDAATFYDRFTSDEGVDLVLEFVGNNIEGAHDERLTVTVPEVHFTGETPKVGGPGVVTVSAPWEAAYDGTNPGVTIEYMTRDIAI
jgi:hypothetical protein